MAIPYRTAKFKSTNILAIAILGSTAKFNSRQYFWLYSTPTHTHTHIHTCTETIVGVNKYKLEKEVPVEVLSIENSKVIAVQKAKLEKLHATRDKAAVEAALNTLTEAASGSGKTNAVMLKLAKWTID